MVIAATLVVALLALRPSPAALRRAQRKLDERLDAASEAALAPAAIAREEEQGARRRPPWLRTRDEEQTQSPPPPPSLFERKSAPERAAEWLVSQYEERYGTVEVSRKDRGPRR